MYFHCPLDGLEAKVTNVKDESGDYVEVYCVCDECGFEFSINLSWDEFDEFFSDAEKEKWFPNYYKKNEEENLI